MSIRLWWGGVRSFKEELIFLLHLLRETRSLNLWVALLSTGGLAACLHIFFFFCYCTRRIDDTMSRPIEPTSGIYLIYIGGWGPFILLLLFTSEKVNAVGLGADVIHWVGVSHTPNGGEETSPTAACKESRGTPIFGPLLLPAYSGFDHLRPFDPYLVPDV